MKIQCTANACEHVVQNIKIRDNNIYFKGYQSLLIFKSPGLIQIQNVEITQDKHWTIHSGKCNF